MAINIPLGVPLGVLGILKILRFILYVVSWPLVVPLLWLDDIINHWEH